MNTYYVKCIDTAGNANADDSVISFNVAQSVNTYLLQTFTSGSGAGTITGTGINCGSDCSQTFNEGSSVTLTATSGANSVFAGWNGVCSGVGTCTLNMNSNKDVTAIFNNVPTGSLPRPDHIVIVIEENRGYSNIIGSLDAPYFNQLVSQGALFTNSYAITHPSQPNYLALFSGSKQGVVDDTCVPPGSPYLTPNLGRELRDNSFGFGGYSQSLSSIGSTACGGGAYARKHNPWVDWQGAGANQLPASVNMPFTSFPTVANYDALPTVSIVVPDLDHDMHDRTGKTDQEVIQSGDMWLRDNIDSYAQWAESHNSLLIITWDEDGGPRGPDNQIPTLFVGQMVKQGQYNECIDHYSVLRTIEDMYGLGHAGSASPRGICTGSATAITDVWQDAFPPTDLTVQYVSHSEAASAHGVTSITVPRPPQYQSGDLLVAVLTADYAHVGSTSGWTLAHEYREGGPNLHDLTTHVFWRVAGASEQASYTWPLITNDITHSFAGATIMAFRGADTTNPIFSTAINPQTPWLTPNPYVNCPSTSGIAGGVLICAFAHDDPQLMDVSASMAQLTMFTLWGDGHAVAYDNLISDGASGVRTATLDPNVGGGKNNMALATVIRPG